MKPIKRGIKTWVRADSISSYMCDFNIYEGKDERPEKELGRKVVKTLCEDIYNKNYWGFLNTFYQCCLHGRPSCKKYTGQFKRFTLGDHPRTRN